MVLDTTDGKRSYSESQYISLIIQYSSGIRYKYKVETGLGMNSAAESQRLYTDEPTTPVAYLGGTVCCGSQLKPLNSKSLVVTPFMRFRLKPGKRELYVTASQVFPWGTTAVSGTEEGFPTTSTILWLDIAPDPGWQQRELAKIVQEYGAQSQVLGSKLSELDIPEAATEKLKLIDRSDHCRVSFQRVEYELAQGTIEHWIHDPDHGVTTAAMEVLASMRADMSHPELADWFEDPAEQKASPGSWISALKVAKTSLVEEICTALPAKSHAAQVSTKQSVCETLKTAPIVKNTTCGCQAASTNH